MLTNEDRKYILQSFLETIEGISDKEYQKRIWIRGEGPEVDSFDDTINDFFSESEPILENYKDFAITESRYQILKKFRDQLQIFSKEHNEDWPQLFIDTPEWNEIIETAKDVLKAFDYKKVRN